MHSCLQATPWPLHGSKSLPRSWHFSPPITVNIFSHSLWGRRWWSQILWSLFCLKRGGSWLANCLPGRSDRDGKRKVNPYKPKANRKIRRVCKQHQGIPASSPFSSPGLTCTNWYYSFSFSNRANIHCQPKLLASLGCHPQERWGVDFLLGFRMTPHGIAGVMRNMASYFTVKAKDMATRTTALESQVLQR